MRSNNSLSSVRFSVSVHVVFNSWHSYTWNSWHGCTEWKRESERKEFVFNTIWNERWTTPCDAMPWHEHAAQSLSMENRLICNEWRLKMKRLNTQSQWVNRFSIHGWCLVRIYNIHTLIHAFIFCGQHNVQRQWITWPLRERERETCAVVCEQNIDQHCARKE